jgi:hypothetical protein
MKNFLAIYLGTQENLEKSSWRQMDPARRKELETQGMRAWGDWMKTHEAAVVVQGSPLGKTKRTSAKGVEDTRNNMVGFIVVRAESHEAAAKMFENHPHFAIFPGESVEIMECLPVPGMEK